MPCQLAAQDEVVGQGGDINMQPREMPRLGRDNSRSNSTIRSQALAALRRLNHRGESIRVTLLFVVILCSAGTTPGLERDKNIDQYGHDSWTSQNGLPGEAVYQILQTPDGYLWLRTSAGLVRFDGVRFILVDPVIGNTPIGEPINAICKDPDGNLLIRTTSRTILYKDGVFSDYLPPAPLPDGGIRTLFESQEHEVFIGADDFIYVIRNGQLKMLRRGTAWVNTFFEDEKGLLWIGASTGLYTYRNGVLSAPWNDGAIGANVVAGDLDHNVWVGTVSSGLYRMNQARSALEPVARDAIHSEVHAILEDRQKNLWVGTNAGMYRLTGGRVASFNLLDGLTDSRVLSLYEDREGSLWVGTSGGLDRFRDTKVTTITSREGLPSDEIKSAIETRDGSLYVFCSGAGLGRIKNGVVTAIPKQKGVPDFYGNALFESRDGSLWIGLVGGLTQYKDGKFTVYSADERLSKPFISAISEDEESLIVTTSDTVALRFKDGKVGPFTFGGQTTPLSKPGNYTFTIYRDPAGTLWFGTVQGLFKFARGESPANAQQKQIDFPVTSISDDQRGSLWLGGRTPGLIRFRISDGRVTRYTKKAGLFDDYLTRILTDDHNNLWISTANGIYEANGNDLDAFADGRASTVPTTIYGIADGMKTSEASSPAAQPGGWRTHDGKLWFATRKGIVAIDPNHLVHNDLIPPVVIEDVVADNETFSARRDLQVGPGKDRIEFHYTSLSLLIPARVQFKYMLEGHDTDWVNAGSRRVAYYTNLPPGKYRFRVIGSNDDGVWNNAGASVAIYLKPHVYQTTWFYSLCALAIILCAIVGQRLYTHRLRMRAKELTRIVGERTKDLEAQRAFLRQVIEISPNFIFVKDREGRYTLINQAVSDVFGAPVEKLLGKTDDDLTPHRHEAAAFRRDDQEVLNSLRGKVINEETITDSHGHVHWLHTVKRPIASPDGKSVHLLGVATDITELKEAGQQLRLQAAALESAANSIVITDRQAVILWVNAAFSKLTGYSASEAIGQNPRILQSGQHPRSFYEDMWNKLLSGQIWQGEIINRKKDGQLYTEGMTITPVRDSHGDIAHFIAIKQDVTEQKALERQLYQAQKMEAVGQLAGGVAHDFNNLMGVILGYSELLEEEFTSSDPNRKKIEQMRKAAVRAALLTRQLLAFSRQQVLQPVVMDLNATVVDMHKMLCRLISEDINLVTVLQPHLGHVKADPTQIEQIIMNLAVNARDAMPQGGTLTIETSDVDLDENYARQHAVVTKGSYVKLEVSDTGVGIDKEIQAHIFEPFFTTKGIAQGTGLGLSTVYGIVKQSGGYIWVYSEPGHGTTFKIYLPRIEEALQQPKEEKPAFVPRGTETILVVEDATPLLELTSEFLEGCGYTVLPAGGAAEAMRIVEKQKELIPLLITDIVMPEMSGRALAEKLTAIQPSLRVLYMSGYTDDTILRYGAMDSGQGFLQKPFTKKELAIKVRELLDASTS
jgi:PAS domain S-box-containing protein